ncbi:FAD-dependent oxidoreductase [Nocardioides dongkuii]|uniref:FAD-dependent oxidoreductase n=1 Tax=Nocardioides dongkuii TaxID=2760089 RepID=UPI001877E1DC|nr:FAD-dependent oxidoreductase [Nocardioides dongkuii]
MAFAITQTCCADASCVSVCPVNCIHPTPEERAFGSTDMLHIDPETCIDCGACADVCPTDAIFPVDRLVGSDRAYAQINADYYADDEQALEWDPPAFPTSLPSGRRPLDVAVVGSGPAAGYALESLLTTNTRVTVYERLGRPGGLLRYGVAPDHLATRRMAERFAAHHLNPRVRVRLGTEVGTDVSHAELQERHDAVVYAVGASADRRLDVPGAELVGSLSARTFVGWYNGHPDVPQDAVDLSTERVTIIGTGNVALDCARILLSDPDRLAATDIAPHALAALRRSRVRHVVIAGRRGPADASYSRGELIALQQHADFRLVVVETPGVVAEIGTAGPNSKASWLAGVPTRPVAALSEPPTERCLILLFGSRATSFGAAPGGRIGTARLEVSGSEAAVDVTTGLVLSSIGYRGTPVAGLPFDDVTGTIPHQAGRVVDPVTGSLVPSTYVTGWIKRGPSGGIGANRLCAHETVSAVLQDAADRPPRRVSAGRSRGGSPGRST